METPLRGRSGGHTGPPLRVLLERIARGCSPLRFRLGGLRVGRLISFGQIACGWLVSFGRITRECRMAFGWIVHDVRACCLGA